MKSESFNRVSINHMQYYIVNVKVTDYFPKKEKVNLPKAVAKIITEMEELLQLLENTI